MSKTAINVPVKQKCNVVEMTEEIKLRLNLRKSARKPNLLMETEKSC